ncbi:hypothetical protein DFQ13_11670 [Actinokineospora spheciospongiae]|nr:hypothetical protein DFQ13_11670 [Actinokineospora spheciospongiae]
MSLADTNPHIDRRYDDAIVTRGAAGPTGPGVMGVLTMSSNAGPPDAALSR